MGIFKKVKDFFTGSTNTTGSNKSAAGRSRTSTGTAKTTSGTKSTGKPKQTAKSADVKFNVNTSRSSTNNITKGTVSVAKMVDSKKTAKDLGVKFNISTYKPNPAAKQSAPIQSEMDRRSTAAEVFQPVQSTPPAITKGASMFGDKSSHFGTRTTAFDMPHLDAKKGTYTINAPTAPKNPEPLRIIQTKGEKLSSKSVAADPSILFRKRSVDFYNDYADRSARNPNYDPIASYMDMARRAPALETSGSLNPRERILNRRTDEERLSDYEKNYTEPFKIKQNGTTWTVNPNAIKSLQIPDRLKPYNSTPEQMSGYELIPEAKPYVDAARNMPNILDGSITVDRTVRQWMDGKNNWHREYTFTDGHGKKYTFLDSEINSSACVDLNARYLSKYMSVEEQTAYLFFLRRDGENSARSYLSTLSAALNDRWSREETFKEGYDFAKNNPVLARAATPLIAGYGGFVDYINQVAADGTSDYGSAQTTIFHTLKQGMEQAENEGHGKVYEYVNGIANMTLSFLPASFIGPLSSVFSMDLAIADSRSDRINEGTETTRSKYVALAQGLTMAIPFSRFGNAFALPAKVITGIGTQSSTKSAIAGMTGWILSHFGASAAMTVTNQAIDFAIMGDESQYSKLIEMYMKAGMPRAAAIRQARVDIAKAISRDTIAFGLLGMIHGAIGGELQNPLAESVTFKARGEEILAEGRTMSDVLADAEATGRNSDARRNAEHLKARYEEGKPITASMIGAQEILNVIDAERQNTYRRQMQQLTGLSIGEAETKANTNGEYIGTKEQGLVKVSPTTELPREEAVAHEVQHAAGTEEYHKAVEDALRGTDSLDRLKKNIVDNRKLLGLPELSDQALTDEVSSVVTQELAGSTKDISRMLRLAEGNPTLADKLYRGVRDLRARMYAKGHKTYTPSDNSYSIKYRDLLGLEKAWEQVITTVRERGYNPTDGEHVYSVHKDADGKLYIKIDKDILAGIPEKDWFKTAKSELKKFKDGVDYNGEIIAVSGKSRSEFVGSDDTKGMDSEGRANKLRTSANIDEIIQNQRDANNESPNHERTDDIISFDRGYATIQIGENTFEAEVLLANKQDGTRQFYDLVKMEPKKNTALRQSDRKHADTEATNNAVSDNPTIPQSEDAVNTFPQNNEPLFSVKKAGDTATWGRNIERDLTDFGRHVVMGKTWNKLMKGNAKELVREAYRLMDEGNLAEGEARLRDAGSYFADNIKRKRGETITPESRSKIIDSFVDKFRRNYEDGKNYLTSRELTPQAETDRTEFNLGINKYTRDLLRDIGVKPNAINETEENAIREAFRHLKQGNEAAARSALDDISENLYRTAERGMTEREQVFMEWMTTANLDRDSITEFGTPEQANRLADISRRAAPGKISRQKRKPDEFYQELASVFPDILPSADNMTNPAETLLDTIDRIEANARQPRYSPEDLIGSTKDFADRVIDDFYRAQPAAEQTPRETARRDFIKYNADIEGDFRGLLDNSTEGEIRDAADAVRRTLDNILVSSEEWDDPIGPYEELVNNIDKVVAKITKGKNRSVDEKQQLIAQLYESIWSNADHMLSAAAERERDNITRETINGNAAAAELARARLNRYTETGEKLSNANERMSRVYSNTGQKSWMNDSMRAEMERQSEFFRYRRQTNAETSNAAQNRFDATRPDSLFNELAVTQQWTAEDIAASGLLMTHYQNIGRETKAVELYEIFREKATTAGQMIQAISMFNKLTPDGKFMILSNEHERNIEQQIRKKFPHEADAIIKEWERAKRRDRAEQKQAEDWLYENDPGYRRNADMREEKESAVPNARREKIEADQAAAEIIESAEEVEKRIKQTKKVIDYDEANIGTLKKLAENLEELERLQEEVKSIDMSRKKLKATQSRIAELQREIAANHEELAKVEADVIDASARRTKLEKIYDNTKLDIESAHKRLEAANQELKEMQNATDALHETLSDLRTDEIEASKRAVNAERALKELEKEIKRLEKNLSTAEKMRRRGSSEEDVKAQIERVLENVGLVTEGEKGLAELSRKSLKKTLDGLEKGIGKLEMMESAGEPSYEINKFRKQLLKELGLKSETYDMFTGTETEKLKKLLNWAKQALDDTRSPKAAKDSLSHVDRLFDRLGLQTVNEQSLADFRESLLMIEEFDDPNKVIDMIMSQSKMRGTPHHKVTELSLKLLAKNDGNMVVLKDIATQQLFGMVSDMEKATFGRKVSTVLAIHQLGSLRTAIRNVLANSAFQVVEGWTTHNIAAFLDWAVVSRITGERAVTAEVPFWARGNSLKRANAAYLEAALNVDILNSNPHELAPTKNRSFKRGPGAALERGLGYELTVPDEFAKGATEGKLRAGFERMVDFYKKHYGNDWEKHMWTEAEMNEIIEKELLYRTFQDNSKPAQLLQGFKETLNKVGFNYIGEGGFDLNENGTHDFGLGNLVCNYTVVPGNILTRAYEYSPLGVLKLIKDVSVLGIELQKRKSLPEGVTEATRGEFVRRHQREILLDASRSLTGAGLIFAGYLLKKNGVFVMAADSDDDYNKSKYDKSKGMGEFQINISALERMFSHKDANGNETIKSAFDGAEPRDGDILKDLTWLSPINTELQLGAIIAQSIGSTDFNPFSREFMTGFAESTLDSMFDGAKDLSVYTGIKNVVNNWKYTDGMGEFAFAESADLLLSFMPSLVNQIGNVLDEKSRYPYKADDVFQLAKWKLYSKLPIMPLREQVPERVNLWGEEQSSTLGGKSAIDIMGNKVYPMDIFNNMIFPGQISKYEKNAMTDELDRLADYDSDVLPKTPYNNNSVTIDNEIFNFTLKGEEYQRFSQTLGKETVENMMLFMTSEDYKLLSDAQRVEELKKISYETNIAVQTAYALMRRGKTEDEMRASSDELKEEYKNAAANYVLIRQAEDYVQSPGVQVEEVIEAYVYRDYTAEEVTEAIKKNNEYIAKVKAGTYYRMDEGADGKKHKVYSRNWTAAEREKKISEFEKANEDINSGKRQKKEYVEGEWTDLTKEQREQVLKNISKYTDEITLPDEVLANKPDMSGEGFEKEQEHDSDYYDLSVKPGQTNKRNFFELMGGNSDWRVPEPGSVDIDGGKAAQKRQPGQILSDADLKTLNVYAGSQYGGYSGSQRGRARRNYTRGYRRRKYRRYRRGRRYRYKRSSRRRGSYSSRNRNTLGAIASRFLSRNGTNRFGRYPGSAGKRRFSSPFRNTAYRPDKHGEYKKSAVTLTPSTIESPAVPDLTA